MRKADKMLLAISPGLDPGSLLGRGPIGDRRTWCESPSARTEGVCHQMRKSHMTHWRIAIVTMLAFSILPVTGMAAPND